jgi:hypothetical protein
MRGSRLRRFTILACAASPCAVFGSFAVTGILLAMPLVFIALIPLMLVPWAIVHLMVRLRSFFEAAVPLALCAATIAFAKWGPMQDWGQRANFTMYRDERNEIVRRISQRESLPSKPQYELLDSAASLGLTQGRSIRIQKVDQTVVVFFRTLRHPDGYAGYVYVSSGGDPRSFWTDAVGQIHPSAVVRQMDTNWYWVIGP